MILHHNIIKTIEGLLEKGYTVELRLEESIPAAGAKDKPRMPQIKINKRPNDPRDLNIDSILINEHAPTDLVLYAIKLGEAPIELVTFVAPAGFYLTGLKGYQAIS